MATYDPWADASRRYPATHIETDHPLPPFVSTAWVRDDDVVFLSPALDGPAARCGLARQIAHMDLRHTAPGTVCTERVEREAVELAARRLVDVDDLAVGVTALADAVGVTVEVLLARVRMLTPDECERVFPGSDVAERRRRDGAA